MTPRKEGETKKLVSARLPPDLYQQFEEYRDEHGIDNTTALRRLLRDSLKPSEGTENTPSTDPVLLGVSTGLLAGYIGLLYVNANPVVWKVLTGALITVNLLYALSPTLLSLYHR